MPETFRQLLTPSCSGNSLLPLLFLFVSSALLAQPDQKRIDSLEQVFRSRQPVENRLAACWFLLDNLKNTNPDQAQKLAAEYLALAEKSGNAFETARANLWRGCLSADSTDFFVGKTLKFIEANRADPRTKKLEIWTNLLWGNVLRDLGQYEKAIPMLRMAEQNATDERERMLANFGLGHALSTQNNVVESLEYLKKVREQALRLADKTMQAESLKAIGDIYADLSDFRPALENLRKAQTIFDEMGDRNNSMMCLFSISRVLCANDSTVQEGLKTLREQLKMATELGHETLINYSLYGLGWTYFEIKETETGLPFAKKVFERVQNRPDDESFKWMVLTLMARYANRQKDYPRALQLAQRARSGYDRANAEERGDDFLNILHELAHARLGLGQVEAGFEAIDQYETLLKDLNVAAVKDEIAKTEVQFRVKENEFALQESKRTNLLQTEKAAAQRNLFIGLLAAAGLFLLFGWMAFRRSQRDKALIFNQKGLIERSLAEKETLLKEIHHRVKNNLQIISGLLEKQARKTTDEVTRKLMKEGQDRVFSMALVHQNLYQSDNLSAIEIKSYLEALTRNIQSSQATPDQKIEVKLDVDDSTLDIDTAIPVALILNELITNAFKYAFSGRAAGLICIDFHQKANDFFLKVRDNGIGLAADFDISKTKSLGLNLVHGLVGQLEGQFRFGNLAEGAFFEVQFVRD